MEVKIMKTIITISNDFLRREIPKEARFVLDGLEDVHHSTISDMNHYMNIMIHFLTLFGYGDIEYIYRHELGIMVRHEQGVRFLIDDIEYSF